MSLPRPILPGTSYLVTRSCTQQQFLLLPNRLTAAVFLFCLALAQQVTKVKIHAIVVMSNHYHLVITDPLGRLPEFVQILNKFVAKCLNAHYGRCENLWAAGEQTSFVELGDDDALLEKAAYTVTNPVAAGLVPRHQDWPGLLLWRPGRYKAKRPSWFFREDGPVPKTLHLELEPLPFSDDPIVREATHRLGAEIAAREQALRADLRAAGRRFAGVTELRRYQHTDTPATRRGLGTLSPRVATRNRWRRIELLQRLKSFAVDHRAAMKRWRDGVRTALFPAGTYKMAREHGVLCADC